MTTETKPLEVLLYVCPECLLVGKIPGSNGSHSFHGYCTGPPQDPHKRVSMKLRLFIEARDKEGP